MKYKAHRFMWRQAEWVTVELYHPGYEDVVWIPKGSVHIFIQDLNLSLSHLGKQRWRDEDCDSMGVVGQTK